MGVVRKKEFVLDDAAAPEDNNECRKHTQQKHNAKNGKQFYRK